LEAFGGWAEASAADDEAAAVALVRPRQSFFEAEAARELKRGGLLGDEGVRAAFEQEAFASVCADSPAQAFGGFEQEDFRPRLFRGVLQLEEAVSGGEAADAAADDDDAPTL